VDASSKEAKEKKSLYLHYRRNYMSKKYGFKNYTVLDRRQFDLLMWNLMKTLSDNDEQVSSSSSSSSYLNKE